MLFSWHWLNLSNSERVAKDVKSSKERESKDRKDFLIVSVIINNENLLNELVKGEKIGVVIYRKDEKGKRGTRTSDRMFVTFFTMHGFEVIV
jgi:hypothetical protein